MATQRPAGRQPGQMRCPVCWNWFTPDHTTNPNPRRYCTQSCRTQDQRRRQEHAHAHKLLDAKLEQIRQINNENSEHPRHR